MTDGRKLKTCHPLSPQTQVGGRRKKQHSKNKCRLLFELKASLQSRPSNNSPTAPTNDIYRKYLWSVSSWFCQEIGRFKSLPRSWKSPSMFKQRRWPPWGMCQVQSTYQVKIGWKKHTTSGVEPVSTSSWIWFNEVSCSGNPPLGQNNNKNHITLVVSGSLGAGPQDIDRTGGKINNPKHGFNTSVCAYIPMYSRMMMTSIIYLEPKWPMVCLEKALFWGVGLQK